MIQCWRSGILGIKGSTQHESLRLQVLLPHLFTLSSSRITTLPRLSEPRISSPLSTQISAKLMEHQSLLQFRPLHRHHLLAVMLFPQLQTSTLNLHIRLSVSQVRSVMVPFGLPKSPRRSKQIRNWKLANQNGRILLRRENSARRRRRRACSVLQRVLTVELGLQALDRR